MATSKLKARFAQSYVVEQSCGLWLFSVERLRDRVRYPKENISTLALYSFG